jgi:cytochrome c553
MKRIATVAILALTGIMPVFAGSSASGKPEKPAGLPANLEPAFKTWAQKCSQCHDPERAYNPNYVDGKSIQALVSRMARKPDAAITKADQKKIVSYLTWHNGRDTK